MATKKNTVKVKKIRSVIKQTQCHKDTMLALGLKKMNSTSMHTLTPAIAGMLKKVAHLIEIVPQ